MKVYGEKSESSIKEYLLKKRSLYRQKNIELEISLEEKKEYIAEIKQRKILLDQRERFDDTAELFTPFQKIMVNDNKLEEYVNKENLLREECKNLEKEMKQNNSEIDEISQILIEVFKEISKVSNDQENLFGNHSILKSQEYENQRISRDLHDSIVQSLTSYIHKIELIQQFIDVDSNRCRLELELLRVNIKKSINELREIIYNLRPMSFDDIGMKVTLENLVNQIQLDNDVNVIYKINEDFISKLDDVDPIISMSLLRIIQEACSNSIRHGEAETIYLTITVKSSYIEMKVSDDGKGFDKKSIYNLDRNEKSGYGISIMKERVLLLQGNINIDSKVNTGTEITIRVPIKCEGE